MLLRVYSLAKLEMSINWLKRQNAMGRDIYIRPTTAGAQNFGYILLDDLTATSLENLKADGYRPVAVLETSPGNHQAWVRVSYQPLEPKVATLVAKDLAARYGADSGSADWMHYGRLAGFTNTKLKHTKGDGQQPFVLLRETGNGEVSPPGLALVEAARSRIESERRVEKIVATVPDYNGEDSDQWFTARAADLMIARNIVEWKSEHDFAVAKDMIKAGFSEDQVALSIENRSPNVNERKGAKVDTYAARTARTAASSVRKDRIGYQQRSEMEATRLVAGHLPDIEDSTSAGLGL